MDAHATHPCPASSVGVVTVQSSSRGSARGLAPDVGGEHVGLLGGGAPVGRWPLLVALAFVGLEVTLFLLTALFLD
jgi:hypothetical protein